VSLYASPIWTCGICEKRGPWAYTCRWHDECARTEVPAGPTLWLEPAARQVIACSKSCARAFAMAAGSARLGITKPENDSKHLLRAIAQQHEDKRNRRRAA
jgi:hypothetical protein